MIGLIDYDLQSSTSINLTPPNLEIMKLAAYYRLEENTFCQLVPLDKNVENEYDQLYVFSESETPVILPPNLIAAKNIVLGGTAFTNGEYIPFSNSLIDYTLPRTNIYSEYLKNKYNDGIKAKIISNLLDATYYRCKAGNKVLPIPAIRPGKQVFIYDRILFIEEWDSIIEQIVDHKPSSIVFVHPIFCKTLTQFFMIRNNPKISRDNRIILDLDIPLEDLNHLFTNYKNALLADITKTSHVFITLGGSFQSSFAYYKDLIYKLNLLYAFWAKGIPLKIYYTYPKIGFTDPIATLSQRIASWSRRLAATKSVNQIIEFKTKKADHTAEEQRNLLLKFYPSAADLFTQNQTDLMKKRMWRI